MKNILKILAMLLVGVVAFTSCEEEDKTYTGPPQVEFPYDYEFGAEVTMFDSTNVELQIQAISTTMPESDWTVNYDLITEGEDIIIGEDTLTMDAPANLITPGPAKINAGTLFGTVNLTLASSGGETYSFGVVLQDSDDIEVAENYKKLVIVFNNQ